MLDYIFVNPNGSATIFNARQKSARVILHALLGHWNRERVSFGLINASEEVWTGEADTQASHVEADRITA